MKCPVCGTWTLVKETRQRAENAKYRRYECANEHRFTTLEKVAKVIAAKKAKDYGLSLVA
jgi:transcriptional regulator NrdR family protein